MDLFVHGGVCQKDENGDTDRYVFSINDASELPDFPFAMNDIHTSPYMAR